MEMGLKSIGLCPRGFETPGCKWGAGKVLLVEGEQMWHSGRLNREIRIMEKRHIREAALSYGGGGGEEGRKASSKNWHSHLRRLVVFKVVAVGIRALGVPAHNIVIFSNLRGSVEICDSASVSEVALRRREREGGREGQRPRIIHLPLVLSWPKSLS
jgi:hypothetical protein